MTKINYKETSNKDTEIVCGDWVQISFSNGNYALVLYSRIGSGGSYKLIGVTEYEANRYTEKIFRSETIPLKEVAKEIGEDICKLSKVNVEINVTDAT